MSGVAYICGLRDGDTALKLRKVAIFVITTWPGYRSDRTDRFLPSYVWASVSSVIDEDA